MSATVADGSVQKYARHPAGSSTSTTRITPPAGFHVARNVLYRLVTGSPYRVNASVVHPRRWPALLARLTRSVPESLGRPGPFWPGGITGGSDHSAASHRSR